MTTTLAAELRTEAGKGVARKLRAAGRVPAVIYGSAGTATPLSIDPIALLDIFRKSRNRNTIITLDLNGKPTHALVKEAQRHPVSRAVLHVDFYEVAEGLPIEVMVPVRPVGRPAGASIGGRIELYRRDLRIRATFDKIPEFVDVDVTPLEIGQRINASEITTADGVEIVRDRDFPVAQCAGKAKK